MIKVDYIAPVSQSHALAIHSRRIIKLLDQQADVRVVGFNPQEINNRISQEEIQLLMRLSTKAERAPDVRIFHSLPVAYMPDPSCYNIGILSWETSKIPCRDLDLRNGAPPQLNNWATQIQKMDEMWTFSVNGREAIKKSGFNKKITIIPGPIDTDFFSPEEDIHTLPIMGVTVDKKGRNIVDKFVVGYVADWNERKDLETFISVTSLALPPDDSVIVLKTKDYIGNQDLREVVETIKNRLLVSKLPPIAIVDQDLSPEEMRSLINSFDVYASTSRGEGLNLPVLEAMALEKNIVAPAHSAHLDYMEQGKNANLIGVNLEICRTSVKNPWYFNDQVWGKVNEVQYLQCLQHLHKQWKSGTLEPNKAGRKTVVNKYSNKACENALRSVFKGMQSRVDSNGQSSDTEAQPV